MPSTDLLSLMTTSKTSISAPTQSSASLSTTSSASSATAGEGDQSWRKVLSALRDRRVLTMLFLGFAAGIPLLLIFSSLSLWLREAGVERGAVTFFSWAALGYSFKFIWAPLVDRLPLPWLTRRYGRRRG